MLSVPILLGSSFTSYFLSFLFPFHVFPLDPAPWWEIRWHRHQQQHGWERQSMARVFSLFAAKILCNFFPFCVIFPELFFFANFHVLEFNFRHFFLFVFYLANLCPNFSAAKFFLNKIFLDFYFQIYLISHPFFYENFMVNFFFRNFQSFVANFL